MSPSHTLFVHNSSVLAYVKQVIKWVMENTLFLSDLSTFHLSQTNVLRNCYILAAKGYHVFIQ